MYICTNCRKITQPRVKQHKVTFYEETVHPARYKPVFKRGVFDHMECIDRGGVGKKIVKELAICPECANPQ